MFGCGCLLTLVPLVALAIAGFLAIQPLNEPPPVIAAEASARFDSKAATLASPSAAATVSFGEDEVNAKLAASTALLSNVGIVRSVFVRFRPENRVRGIVLADVFGRPVGGVATFRVGSTGDGQESGIAWEDARIGALPIPI